ncbi:MAG: GNAT family N-acetyltransferase [Chlorobi bacterium]|nr:GNAT family N-acetyltransferase [Chlorobiota bacterium]
MRLAFMTLLKKIIIHTIDKIQGLTIYSRIIRLFPSNVHYIIANSYYLEKYWKWIYLNKEDCKKPIEKYRDYIIALNRRSKIVGSVMLQKIKINGEFKYCVLYSLKVKLGYRRIGIGKDLTLEAIKLADKFKFRELFLSTSAQNFKARQLYNSIGFKEINYNNLIRFYKLEIDSYSKRNMIAYLLDLNKFKNK